MIIGYVINYVFVAPFIGVPAFWAAQDSTRIPVGAEPAVGFLAGMFWPLTLAAGLVWCIWRASRGMCRSFAALWRWWRPIRVSVPRATARERRL